MFYNKNKIAYQLTNKMKHLSIFNVIALSSVILSVLLVNGSTIDYAEGGENWTGTCAGVIFFINGCKYLKFYYRESTRAPLICQPTTMISYHLTMLKV